MANGRIDVYFHSAGEGEPTEEETGKASADGTATAPKSNESSISRSMIGTMAISYAKRMASYGLSIYGDLTGDYQTQNQIETAVGAVATLTMLANFPVGTIAGAFSIATQATSEIIQNRKQDKQTALYLKRTGNETINNSEVD